MNVAGPGLEPDDFDDVFRAHYEPMVRALTVAAGNAETAADCVADAFERAYARWRKISRYENPAAWIQRVAINRLRDVQRRDGRKQRALDRLKGRREPEVEPMAGLEVSETVRELLGGLPERQRMVLALHYVGGWSVAEIAAALDVAEGTVKYHLHAGRESMRANLEGAAR